MLTKVRVSELPVVDLLGMPLARVDRAALLDHMFAELAQRRGGWVITSNIDFLRRHARDPALRQLYASADIRVADGMPLVWAAILQGEPLPERVAGSSLLELLCSRAAAEGRSLYLLGGAQGAATAASAVLRERHPHLRVAGFSSPRIPDQPQESDITLIRAELEQSRPDILLVGLGSPKQERLIEQLRGFFPATWMIGVGISFSFVAGQIRRAPPWMRRSGLEWVHRLAQEPRRLAGRYLIDDLPFAFELFAYALLRRIRARRGRGSGV